MVSGTVRNLTNYGAFIEIEEGIDGLLHVSDMSWTRKIGHPSEVVEKGDKVNCKVLNVDQERKRIALGLKQMANDPWESDIPGRYQPGEIVKGKVTKLTNFGVFVELEPGLEGLLHISELADHKVESPEEVVKVGDEIEVKILRVDADERKIGLSQEERGRPDGPAAGPDSGYAGRRRGVAEFEEGQEGPSRRHRHRRPAVRPTRRRREVSPSLSRDPTGSVPSSGRGSVNSNHSFGFGSGIGAIGIGATSGGE